MAEQQENKMGTAPIGKLLLTMSLPTIFSMLINSLYNVVDGIFVAKIGEKALTAVSLALPLQFLIISFSVGTGIGVNSLISRKLGEKDYEGVDSAANHGFFLAIINYAIFLILGVFFTKPFFNMFTADPDVFKYGVDYTSIVLIMSFGVIMSINCEKTIQGTGNMNYPMLFQLIGAIVNLILDPILIFGMFGIPAMGVKGAAIATVTGQIISMLYALFVITTKDFGFHLNFKGFRVKKETVKLIYKVGFPSIVMQSISSFLTIALNSILIKFSDTAVSVYGVYSKLQSFVFMPIFGLNQGLMPLFGYNFGARNKKRLIDTLKIGMGIACGIMLVGTAGFWLFADKLLIMFSATDEMLRVGIPALRIISSCFVLAGVGIVSSTLFQSVGNGNMSLLVSLIRQLILILPLAYIGARFFEVDAVWYAFPISEGIAMVISLIFVAKIYNTQIKNM